MFPARFQLVGTMNLCPCGGRGDPAVECSCSPQRLASFRDKLSRALLDRFDLVVTVPRARAHELAAEAGEASAAVQERVVAARAVPRAADADEGGRRDADAGGAAAPALGPRPRARRAGRRDDRAPRAAPRRSSRSTSPRRSPTGSRGSWGRRERARARPCGRRRARRLRGRVSRRRAGSAAASSRRRACAGCRDPTGRSRRSSPRSTTRRPACSCAAPPSRSCSRGRASPSSAPAPARPTASQVARRLGRELAAAGIVVVSGLARGIDAEAHRGALEAGGPTVAILGCGIDRDYPAAHRELAPPGRARAA